MPATIVTTGKTYVVEETYAEAKEKLRAAVATGDPVVEFHSRLHAFRGAVPVLIPVEKIEAVEYD